MSNLDGDPLVPYLRVQEAYPAQQLDRLPRTLCHGCVGNSVQVCQHVHGCQQPIP